MTLSNSTLSGNAATDTSGSGGGIRVEGGTVTVSSSSVLSGNSATDGGGIKVDGGAVTVSNSTLSGNSATNGGSGGGIRVEGGTVTVSNSTLSGNSATEGGGFYVNGGTVTIAGNSTVSGNKASNDGEGHGGGFYVNGGTVTIAGNSTVSGNSAVLGGGIAVESGGTVTISNSTLSGNSAVLGGGIIVNGGIVMVSNSTLSGNSAHIGGGINTSGGTLMVSNSTLSGNFASSNGGGGIAVDGGGTVTVSNSTLSGNSATQAGESGGGFYVNGGTLTVSNSTLSGNSATDGGGIVVESGGTVTIGNSTLSGNTATNGGGLFIFDGGTLTVSNSTLSGNSATTGGGIDNSGGMLTVQNSIVSANLPTSGSSPDISGSITNDLGSNLLGSALNGTTTPPINEPNVFSNTPGLAPLGNYGGPTQTMALLPGSPALGAGNGAAANVPPTDQRGFLRLLGRPIDIGAYQSQAAPLQVTTAADPGQLPGQLSLREAVNLANAYANNDALPNITFTITFAPSLNGATITLMPTVDVVSTVGVMLIGQPGGGDGAHAAQGTLPPLGPPVLLSAPLELSGKSSANPTIAIDGGGQITVSGDNATTVFLIDAGVTAVLNGLTITQGSGTTGGGIQNNVGTLTVENCTLSGNSATHTGGGIYNGFGTLTLSNSTLSGNSATTGGGIFNLLGKVTLSNSTLSGNSATTGSGIDNSGGRLTVQNSIVSANLPTNGSSPDISGSITNDLGNNLLGNALNGTTTPPINEPDVFSDTPGLAPLGNYGGPIQTMALLPGSKAIGNGNASAAGLPPTDERGFPRTTGSNPAVLDIGAYQTQGSVTLQVTTPADPGGIPGQLSLREAVNLANAYASNGDPADVTFAASLNSNPITLTQGVLDLNGVPTSGSAAIEIEGGSEQIAVSGNNASTVFQVEPGVNAVLNGLTITQGFATTGGGIANNGGMLTLSNSTLNGNTATNTGGGIANGNGGTLTVANSTLSGNSAGSGGAIASSAAAVTVTNSTLSGNKASGAGGGIAGSGLTLQNSIVSANVGGSGAPDIAGSFTDQGNNLLGTALNGTTTPPINEPDVFSDTPGLAALGNYGGPTQTMALLPGSPALGTGSSTGSPSTDQRGEPRRLDSNSHPIFDIGAFESQGFTVAVVPGNSPQFAALGQAFANPLGVTIAANNPAEPVNGGTIAYIPSVGGNGQSATLGSLTVPISGGHAGVSATANGVAGAYTVLASSGAGSVTFALTNTAAPAFTSAAAATFVAGSVGSFNVSATGPPAATLGENNSDTLPSGVKFNATTGVLSGTPAVGSAGIYVLHFSAANSIGSVNQTFTLTVARAPAITSGTSTTLKVVTAGTFTITTTPGFPTTTKLAASGTLPNGVTFLDNGNGTATLAGKPAPGSGGSYPLTITASTTSNGVTVSQAQTFTLNVDQAPAFTSASATTFFANTPGSFTVTTSGFPVPTLSVKGTLPKGLTFSPATGVIGGTTKTTGTFKLTFTASNGIGSSATQAFTLSVKLPPLAAHGLAVSNSIGITSPTQYTPVTNAPNEFKGTFTLTNTGPALTRPVTLAFGNLPAGVTVVSSPTASSLGKGKTLKLTVVFSTANVSLLMNLQAVVSEEIAQP